MGRSWERQAARAGMAAAIVAAAFGLGAPAAGAQGDDARYALAGGCYALRADGADRFFAERDGGYRATAAEPAGAAPLRMQATDLGKYLLYGKRRDFLALGGSDRIEPAAEAGPAADWTVDVAGEGAFTIVNDAAGRALAVSPGGRLVAVDRSRAGRFGFVPSDGCAAFPEVETNAVGEPSRGATPFGEVKGFVDAHMHMMAFEFLGGRAHCGRPWDPYGVTSALVDCPDHATSCGAVLENTVSYGSPVGCHDPVGWPTFKDWPAHDSLTHEQSYYKWLERAWRGGLRVFVNLFVENHALCAVYPLKKNSCNEMDSVRLQAKDIYALQDYIDAQAGGPGKGFFRIVTDPFEARRVVNDGKLAVVLGIEVSQLFDCNVQNDVPTCDREQIDRQLEEVSRLGVRDMELVNKFDNALGGVAGDAGTTGVIVNGGNRLETGRFWQLETCTGPEHESDNEQYTLPGTARDSLVGNGLRSLLPPGVLPVYPAPPHCNTRPLTDLGEHLVRRMTERGMIVDPDHLDVVSRKQVLALLEAEGYSGVVSSHSWSTPDAYPRIYRLGGVITPYAGSSTGFVKQWREIKQVRDRSRFWGFGYGADMNGFGAQGGPREDSEANPVRYPFRSFDGAVTLDRQRSGERVYDINRDGVAHYGLYPDWIEDLRMIAGDEIVADMARGSEAYLETWERAVGVPGNECRTARARLTRRGVARVPLGARAEDALRAAGQPEDRSGRSWTWCVHGDPRARVEAVFTPQGRVGLVVSTARGHRALRVGRGARADRLQGRARRAGRGLLVSPAGRGQSYVYGVRRGRVRFTAVVSRSVARNRARLRAYLRLAGLR